MTFENLQKRVALLPNEIQYNIMSYSYSHQTPLLCRDIRDYYVTLKETYQCYYNTFIGEWGDSEPEEKNWLINDIYNYMNDYYPMCLGYRENFRGIIERSFVYRYWSNKGLENTLDKFLYKLNKKGVDCEINLVWGLLTPEEREYFMYYSVNSIDITGNVLIAENLIEAEGEEEDWDF